VRFRQTDEPVQVVQGEAAAVGRVAVAGGRDQEAGESETAEKRGHGNLHAQAEHGGRV
jgi:hypothetical protein